jgi:hypothetical protein
MRWSGTAAILGLATALVSPAVDAQPVSPDVEASAEDASPPPARVGYGAMPGGLHTATAEVLPPGTFEVAAVSGFGYRKGLVNTGHTFDRALGEFAFAYAPARHFMLGMSLDARYDKHSGVMDPNAPNTASDDNLVFSPHVLVRAGAPLGKVMVGGQLCIWLPGRDFPSVDLSATTVDALALLSIDAGFGLFTVNGGFRIDNSGKTVNPSDDAFSVGDQVSLGVSNYHAALAGASLHVPAGRRAYVELEGSLHAFVGSGAPGPIVRGGAMAGFAVSDAVTVIAFLEVAHVPEVKLDGSTDPMSPSLLVAQVPYEPMVTGGVGLQARFGGARKRLATSQIVRNERPVPVVVVETADVSGVVVDDAGKPVVGAKVTVKLKNNTGTTVTDDKGAYTVDKLPIGKTVDGKTDLDDTGAEVSVEVANKKPGAATLTLVKGVNSVPRIVLDPMLPPGQLRAVIINLGTSRPVAGANVTIEPGGVTATSDDKGKFQVDLPPGHYKLTVTARGLAQQQLDVNIDPNGVAIKNIELHK